MAGEEEGDESADAFYTAVERALNEMEELKELIKEIYLKVHLNVIMLLVSSRYRDRVCFLALFNLPVILNMTCRCKMNCF